MKFNNNLNLDGISSFLESNGLVQNGQKKLDGTLFFKRVKNCCSLSETSTIKLFLNRILVFVQTFEWYNDQNIKSKIFYEYLWIESKIAFDVKNNNDSKNPIVLEQIAIIKKIMSSIILQGYLKPKTDRKFAGLKVKLSSKEVNENNPKISSFFNILCDGFTGVFLANKILKDLTKIERIYQSLNPSEMLLQKTKLCLPICTATTISSEVGKKYRTLVQQMKNEKGKEELSEEEREGLLESLRDKELVVFRQSLVQPLVGTVQIQIKHGEKEKSRDWWEPLTDKEKIEKLCSHTLNLSNKLQNGYQFTLKSEIF